MSAFGCRPDSTDQMLLDDAVICSGLASPTFRASRDSRRGITRFRGRYSHSCLSFRRGLVDSDGCLCHQVHRPLRREKRQSLQPHLRDDFGNRLFDFAFQRRYDSLLHGVFLH